MSLVFCLCGNYFDTKTDIDRFAYYKLKTPTERFTQRNERILSEVFYHVFCHQCERDIVYIRRTAQNHAGNMKSLVPITLIGKQAEEYLRKTKENRINKTSELTYKEPITCNYIPLVYYATISDTVQRGRYINEAGYSGERVESKVTVIL